MSEAADKICFFCGESCVGLPRGKDPSGNYYHTECMEKANTKKAAEAMMPTFDSADDSGFAMLGADGDDDLDAIGMMADLVSDDEAGVGGAVALAASSDIRCPGCGAGMAGGSVLCVACGYNMQTGASVAPPVIATGGGSGGGDAVWPTILGVITIVWGVCGIGYTVLNVMSTLGQTSSNSSNAAYQTGASIGAIVGMAVPVLLAVWLLSGGVQLLRRRSKAVDTLKRWAITKIILSLICNGIAIAGLVAATAIAGGAGGGPSFLGSGVATSVLLIFVVVLTVWVLGLPIFLLIWFSREAVQAEVAKW